MIYFKKRITNKKNNNKVYNFEVGKISSWEFVKENSTIFSTHQLSKNQFTY